MSITAELENINKFESVGFDHNQAKTLAGVIEKSHQSSHETLKEFFRSALNALELRLNANLSNIKTEIKVSQSELKTEIKASQSDLLIKLFGIIFGSLSIAVAILKLTP